MGCDDLVGELFALNTIVHPQKHFEDIGKDLRLRAVEFHRLLGFVDVDAVDNPESMT